MGPFYEDMIDHDHDWSFIYSIERDHFATRFLYFLIDDLERLQGCTPFRYIFLQPYLYFHNSHVFAHYQLHKDYYNPKAISYRQALALCYPTGGVQYVTVY